MEERTIKLYGGRHLQEMFDKALLEEIKRWKGLNKETGPKKKLNINKKRD